MMHDPLSPPQPLGSKADATLVIRPYAPSDQQQVVALVTGIQQSFGVAITIDDQPDLLDIPAFYQQRQGEFWVALLQEQVIGTLALINLGNGQATIRKMFVHPDYRGKPLCVAQQLWETLRDWSAAQGIQELYLGTTEMFQAAHRFYEKNGFCQIPLSQLPEAFPRMAVDTRFYRYLISD